MDSPTPPTHIDPGTVERLRALHRAEAEAMQAMHATLGQHGADPKCLDEWIAASGALNEAVRQALPGILAALDRTTSDMAVRAEWQDIATAPKDGTPFMVWADGYEWPEVIRWYEYDAETAKEADELGYWHYAEEMLHDTLEWEHDVQYWRALPAAPASDATS